MYFLTVLDARSLSSRCWQSSLLLRPLPAGRQSSSPCALTSSLCACRLPSYKDSSPVRLGPHPYRLINLGHLLKGPISKQSCQEVGLQQINLGVGRTQFIHNNIHCLLLVYRNTIDACMLILYNLAEVIFEFQEDFSFFVCLVFPFFCLTALARIFISQLFRDS